MFISTFTFHFAAISWKKRQSNIVKTDFDFIFQIYWKKKHISTVRRQDCWPAQFWYKRLCCSEDSHELSGLHHSECWEQDSPQSCLSNQTGARTHYDCYENNYIWEFWQCEPPTCRGDLAEWLVLFMATLLRGSFTAILELAQSKVPYVYLIVLNL